MSAFTALIRRDVALALRADGGVAHTTGFFALVIVASAFAVGPDLPVLAGLAPAFVWIAAALAAQLSLERIFQADFEDGTLELVLSSDLLTEAAVLAKCCAAWLTTGLPLLLAAPLAGLLLNLPGADYVPLLVSLALGTPALTLIGAVGAALTVAVRRSGLLTTLVTFPLYTPVLIFGVGAARAPADALWEAPEVLILAALSLAALALAPIGAAACLRASAS